jgi:hypothetical protein
MKWSRVHVQIVLKQKSVFQDGHLVTIKIGILNEKIEL